jgi:hypothetical protein
VLRVEPVTVARPDRTDPAVFLVDGADPAVLRLDGTEPAVFLVDGTDPAAPRLAGAEPAVPRLDAAEPAVAGLDGAESAVGDAAPDRTAMPQSLQYPSGSIVPGQPGVATHGGAAAAVIGSPVGSW